MKFQNIKDDLFSRVYNYLGYSKKKTKTFDPFKSKNVLFKLSEKLRTELQQEIFKNNLQKITILKDNFSSSLISNL